MSGSSASITFSQVPSLPSSSAISVQTWWQSSPLAVHFQRNWAVAGHFVDGQSVNHLTTGRNKRNIAVDMKKEAGKDLIGHLISSSDVVMENFRPGTMSRLGFDPDELLAKYPRLIYATVTGYGSDGPFAHRPGQDLLLQSMSGLAAHTGRADGPPVPVGSVVIDHHAAVLCVTGILFGTVRSYRHRQRAGRVDVSLLQAAIDLQGESIGAWLNGAPHAASRGAEGTAAWFSPGGYGIHATTDGTCRHIDEYSGRSGRCARYPGTRRDAG